MEDELTALRSTLANDPDDVEARRQLVEALLAEGHHDEACEHATLLNETLPQFAWTFELRARVCEQSGDALGAARMRRQLASQEPDTGYVAPGSSRHPSKTPPHGLRAIEEPTSPVEMLPARNMQDIVGLATVKHHLATIVAMVRNSSGRRIRSWPGGTLFYGPNGCGKRYCAGVIAGELETDCFVIAADSGDPVNNVRELLHNAGDTRPVLLIEGIERPKCSVEALERVLEEAAFEHRCVTLGSATLPWQVSPRLVRSGRLDSIVLVLPPDPPARHTFFALRLPALDEASLAWLVLHTDGYSFEELQAITDRVGKDAEAEELRNAVREVPAGSAQWLTTAGHHALMNESSGLYDDLIVYFNARQRHP